jgi:hypothetical protein
LALVQRVSQMLRTKLQLLGVCTQLQGLCSCGASRSLVLAGHGGIRVLPLLGLPVL